MQLFKRVFLLFAKGATVSFNYLLTAAPQDDCICTVHTEFNKWITTALFSPVLSSGIH
jgi:hypothetical protein